MTNKPNLKRQAIEQRSRARRRLLQMLYQWQITEDSPEEVFHNQPDELQKEALDYEYLRNAFFTVTEDINMLETRYEPFMNRRSAATLDKIERAILWIGAYEIIHHPDIHSTVSINEAIELAKQFGGSESYTLINATLDQLAKSLV